MSLFKLLNNLKDDFNEAKDEAINEAVETRNINPIDGPLSVLGLAQRVVNKTRANGRGYVPDLVRAGLELARDIMDKDNDVEEELGEEDIEVVPTDEEAADTFEAKITQIYSEG